MTSLYACHNAFILIYSQLCDPLETASWPTSCKPLV